MSFEINGVSYFLTFDTSESQWCLLTTSAAGIESLEIHNDGTMLTGPAMLVPVGGSASQMD